MDDRKTPSARSVLAEACRCADADDDQEAFRGAVAAYELARETRDVVSQVRAHALASRIAARQGRHPTAAREAVHALVAARGTDQQHLVALARVETARVLLLAGDAAAAHEELQAARPVLQGAGDLEGLCHCRHLMGAAMVAAGDPHTALSHYREAQRVASTAQLQLLEAVAAINIVACWLDFGDAARDEGDGERARDAWQRGLDATDALMETIAAMSVRSASNDAYAAWNRAEFLERLGHDDDALALFTDLRGEGVRLPAVTGLGVVGEIARLLRRRGDLDGAWEALRVGMDDARQAGATSVMAELYELGTEIAEQRGDLESALDWFKRHHVLQREMNAEHAQLREQVLALNLDADRVRAEARRQQDRAHRLAVQYATLSERALQLEADAGTDHLTGLGNRRRLDEGLPPAFASATTNGTSLAIAMLDIDRFKRVNDTYTHLVGDRVLRRVAELLKEHSRPSDVLIRYGGEEFMMAFPGVGVSEAQALCERLRGRVEAEDWDAIAPGLRVTVSIGVCDAAVHADLPAGIGRADALLYEAKVRGRNRVVGDLSPPAPVP